MQKMLCLTSLTSRLKREINKLLNFDLWLPPTSGHSEDLNCFIIWRTRDTATFMHAKCLQFCAKRQYFGHVKEAIILDLGLKNKNTSDSNNGRNDNTGIKKFIFGELSL